MTLDQLVERMPHLQLEDLRFLAGLDRAGHAGTEKFWQLIFDDNTEETLTTNIAYCKRTIKDWTR